MNSIWIKRYWPHLSTSALNHYLLVIYVYTIYFAYIRFHLLVSNPQFTALSLVPMPPKGKGNKRAADVDIQRPSRPAPLPKVERHTHYEPHQRGGVHSYLTAPALPSMDASLESVLFSTKVDDEVPDLVDAELSDDEDEDGEDDRHELEAVGLKDIPKSKRKRTQAVNTNLLGLSI